MEITWEDDFQISVTAQNGTVTISANRSGLLSLAHIITALADEPVGSHVHLDEYNALECPSDELIIERMDGQTV